MVAVAVVLCAGGCTTPRSLPIAPAASPAPTPAPRFGGVVDAPQVTWSDKNNRRIVTIAAAQGAGSGAGAADAVTTLKNATAILHQNGKPVATLRADTLRADRETRTVRASGNVRVQTIGDGAEPPGELRADTVNWKYDANQLHGTGNVVLSRGAQVRIPGTEIVADTRLQSAKITGGDAPITGTLP